MHKRVWSLAAPIILSNVTVPLVGAVDTAVVGHLADITLIGAVAFGALIFSFVYWAFGFLRMGTTGFAAQAWGRNNLTEAYLTLSRAMLIGLSLGALLIIAHPLIGRLALTLFQASLEVESATAVYFGIRIWSAPAVLGLYAILGYLIAAQDMRAVLYTQLLLNGLNMFLDILLVSYFDYGIEGVAVATVCSEYIAIGFGIWLIHRRTGYRVKLTLTHRLLDAGAMRKLLNANFNLFLRTLCLSFSFAWFTNRSAQLGDLYLAANAVLLHLQTISAYALDGFAHAAETLVGHAVGRRNRSALLATIRISTLWALIVSSLISLIYLIAGHHFLSWMTNHSDVLILARAYLPWVVIGPIIAVWSFQLDGIFIGATRTREMRNAMLISLGGYLLAVEASTVLAHNHGLWISLLLFFVLRALTLAFYMPRIIATTY